MSSKFEKVKGYYEAGLWDTRRVHDSVAHGWITADEYQEITGDAYVDA